MSVDFAFIDSGTGGLPYMCFLNEKCPSASCIYVADAQNFPYGEKSTDEICSCVTQLCEKIISRFSYVWFTTLRMHLSKYASTL